MNHIRHSGIAVIILLTLAMPQYASASAGITVSSSGAGVYSIDAAAFDKVAAIEFTITYNQTALSSPRVTQDSLLSGAMVAANPNTPGVIRLAAVTTNPISGSGRLASVVFDSTGSSTGILSISARLSALNGTAIPVRTSVVNSGGSTTVSTNVNQTETATAATTGGAGTLPSTVFTGQVNAPGEARQEVDQPGTENIADQIMTNEEKGLPDSPITASREPRTEKRQSDPQTRKTFTQQSVLNRFREFKGKRTPKALIALFEQDGVIGYRQEPAIAVSDGEKTVKAIFIAPADLDGAPDIAVAGARLVSLGRHPDFTNTWIAELRPYKNACEAAITVALKDLIMVLPVSVAPQAAVDLDKSGRVTDEDFALFMKGSKAGKMKTFDLNRDGKRDYLDDYIFTANYIAGRISG